MKLSLRHLASAFALVVACVNAAPAHAGVLIEPFAGYEFGNIKGTKTDDLYGANVGGRLGFTGLGFMLGGEYALGSLRDQPSSGPGNSATCSDIGAFVGFNFPVLLRVYGTYYFSSTLSDSSSTLQTSTTQSGNYTGSGYRIGVGFTGLPFITVAAELISRSYGKQGSSSTSPSVSANTFALTVTLPLNF